MGKIGKATSLGDELVASLEEGIGILEDRVEPSRFYAAPAAVDVAAIRRSLGLSQAGFAQRFGFSVGTVRNWEQGLRRPDVATRVLLLVIARRPEVVDEVLAADMPVAA